MKKLKHLLAIASIAILGVVSTAKAQVLIVSDQDRNFLQTTSQDLCFGAVSGKLPRSNSNFPAVKAFGFRVVRESSRDYTQLTTLAIRLGVSISTNAGADGIALIKELGNNYSPNFEQPYVKELVKQTLEMIKTHLVEIRDGTNPAVIAYARRNLPQLFTQLQSGLILAQALGVKL